VSDIFLAVDLFRGRAGSEVAPAREERFEVLYRDYFARVLAYCRRRAAAEVASDVVAETFLVAWRRLEELPDEPLPWLIGVARKTLANQRRGAHRRQLLVDRLIAREPLRLSASTEEPSLTVARVAAALERLPESDQELLTLIAWDELSVGEAAGVIGQSAATTRVRLYRARRRLARELASEEVRHPLPKPFPTIAKETKA
jgi:RNA polymerase sigma-70 factor, ECF subfamily